MTIRGANLNQPPHLGSCQCGATRFEVTGSLASVVLCHCTQCRRSNGAAFNVSVVVSIDQVTFQSRKTIKEYESSPGKIRAFCATCGSPIYSRRLDTPGTLRLRGGLITDLPAPSNLQQTHQESRWPWLETIATAPDA